MNRILAIVVGNVVGCTSTPGPVYDAREDVVLEVDVLEDVLEADAEDSSVEDSAMDTLSDTVVDTVVDTLLDTAVEDTYTEPVDPCLGVICGTYEHCVDGVCVCLDGRVRLGGSCVPENQCAAGTDTCDPLAICVYTGPGTYECACPPGYAMVGASCEPIDHCADGTSGCDPRATCHYMGPGLFTCACEGFYVGTPTWCSTYVYSRHFLVGSNPWYPVSHLEQCYAWEEFLAGIPDDAIGISLYGEDPLVGRRCSGAAVASIVYALKNRLSTSVACNGYTWHICASSTWVELFVGSAGCVCEGSEMYALAPCPGTTGTLFGSAGTMCNPAIEQTITLSFALDYALPY